MLKILLKEETHISELARKLNISVPVAAKHIRILEKTGLVERKEYGRSHVLRGRHERLHDLLDVFIEISDVDLSKGRTVLDALKSTCEVNTKRVHDKELLISVNGEEGYYLYEVNGKLANVPMNKHRLKDKDLVKIKKLIPITEKEIAVRVRK